MKPATKGALSDLTAMWQALDAAKAEHCGETVARPPNSFTIREFAQRYEMPESRARDKIKVLLGKKAVKVVRAYVPDAAGILKPTNVYTVAK